MASNYRVQVTALPHPKAANQKEIVECGYIWRVDQTMTRTVSEADRNTLKRESERTCPTLGGDRKMYQVRAARFSFADMGPTDDPVDTGKVPARQVEKVTLPETQVQLLKKNNESLVELIGNLSQVIKNSGTTSLGKNQQGAR